jgi:U3 small nucleolar RNA-associated protein MPP10
MTVEKVKKSSKTSNKTEKFTFLDKLIKKIDEIESEDQVSELFEEEEVLKESFKSLLTLMGSDYAVGEEEGGDFDCDKVDENVMEIMTKLMKEGIVEEEEFEDFFTDELVEGSDVDSEESSSYDDGAMSEEDSDSISNSGFEFDEIPAVTKGQSSKKMTAEEKKKAKNMKELEMLMENVEDESDFETETEGEEEDEVEEGDDNFDDSAEKKDIFEDEKDQLGSRLSSFEKSQIALKDQISALESEQLESQKPWSLRGEINARQRPSDSLLEEAVDFDNLSRPTPTITEERTEEIEDIIKRRIGESAWDDVERKDGRDLTLLNGMQKNNGSKTPRALLENVATADPQRSLTQVYEDEATAKLTGSTAKDQETLDKQADLTAMFAKICRHIDGLSGNRFAPKVYVQSDFQIKTLGGSKK